MTTNEATEKAIELAKRFEGCRLTAYRDGAGKLTIGYGHTGPDVTIHTVWTQAQAEANLLEKMATCIHQAAVASPSLVQYIDKLVAIGDFIYNLGYGAYINSPLKDHIDAHDWQGAAVHIKLYIHAGGKVEEGLVKRRAVEAALLTA